MKKLFFTLCFLAMSVSAQADSVKKFVLSDTIPIQDGGDDYTAFELNLTNSNHTGTGNIHYGFRIPDMTLKAQSLGVAFDIGQGWHYGLHLATNLGILFGPFAGGTQVYFDGSVLSVSDSLTLYGDLTLNGRGIKEFDILGITVEDVQSVACKDGQIRIDVGGVTKELCVCESTEWQCAPLRKGPLD